MREEYISGEEAEWTRQALGLSVSDFAKLCGVSPVTVYGWRDKPQTLLHQSKATLLTLAVNRLIPLTKTSDQTLFKAASDHRNWKPVKSGGNNV